MAAPASHIIFAKIIADKLFPDLNEQEYYIGTLFPDIRYIADIDRDSTHSNNIDLNALQTESSFTKGFKVHSFIDQTREEFMQQNGIYEIIPKIQLTTQVLKIYEDSLLYTEINNWNYYLGFFTETISEEEKFPIEKETIERWHRIMKFYLEKKPDEETTKKFLGSKLQQQDNSSEIKELLETLKENKKVEKLIWEFYDKVKQEFK